MAEMLGTADPEQQRQVVQMLCQPTISIVLTVDPKMDRVTITPISSMDVPAQMVQRILTLAGEELIRILVQQAGQQQQSETAAPPAPPSIPDPPQRAQTA